MPEVSTTGQTAGEAQAQSPDSTTSAAPPVSIVSQPYAAQQLSDLQIAALGYWAGFNGDQLVTIIQITLAESNGYTAARDDDSNGSIDRGILAINTINGCFPPGGRAAVQPGVFLPQYGFDGLPVGTVSNDPPDNPFFAFQWAYQESGAGANFQAWSSDLPHRAQYLNRATAAANQVIALHGDPSVLPTGGGTGAVPATNDNNALLGFNLVNSNTAPTTPPTLYGPKPIWTVDEILVTGFANTTGPTRLQDIVYEGTNLKSLLVSAQVELSSTSSSLLTLTFERGDELLYDGRLFPDSNNVVVLTIRNMKMTVNEVDLQTDEAQQPQLVVKCVSVGFFGLQYIFGQDLPAVVANQDSATSWIKKLCDLVFDGPTTFPFYGQNTIVQPIAITPIGDPATGQLPDSGWTVIQTLAQQNGFWAFEAGGALWFAQPSQLAQWGNEIHVTYDRSGYTPRPTNCVGVPKVSATIQQIPSGVFATVKYVATVRTVQVDLPQWYGQQVKPGDCLVLQGLSGNFDTPTSLPAIRTGLDPGLPNTLDPPTENYVVTMVSFTIDGGVTTVSVTGEEAIDPNPQIPNAAGVDTGDSATANPGGTFDEKVGGTAYTGAQSNSKNNLDFLATAYAEVGVPYVWGGDTPTQGFDCSGLVQWAANQVGVSIPRTSQTQWQAILAAGTQIGVTQALNTPGALLFFADPPSAPSHVAISMGDGANILQAPETGEDVQVIPYYSTLSQAGKIPGMTYTAAQVGTTATGGSTSPDLLPIAKLRSALGIAANS